MRPLSSIWSRDETELLDDPGAYTKPFSLSWDIPWRANGELTEYICQENNKYLQRLTDDFGEPIFKK